MTDHAIVFSGGTDSTCAAALAAESGKYARIHLVTFFETATRKNGAPHRNVEALRRRFPSVEFLPRYISVDPLVRKLSYDRYWHYFRKHGALVLATPGFSSLSWHSRMVAYCLEHGIKSVSDGLTRELMHFPGHMTEVIAVFRELYSRFGIEYTNPVRDWEVPEDRQFIDQMIVNTHGDDFLLGEDESRLRTTGRHLHALGILPKPNVKGSKLDRLMQQDCYPFAIYNILAFWCYLSWEPYPVFCSRLERIFREKAADVEKWLREFSMNKDQPAMRELFATPSVS